MKILPNISKILAVLLLTLTCVVVPFAAQAQSEQSAHFGLVVSDEQIASWNQRESEVVHPVMATLEKVDRATLHFYYPREYTQRATSVVKSAESARDKTLRFLPAETVADVHVYLLGNINRYFEALDLPGRAPDWAAGITLLQSGVIIIRLDSSGLTRIEPQMTLAHELNHVALRRFAQNAVFPHWFYEGLAMTATDDWSLQRAETLANATLSGKLLDLKEIDEAFGKKGAIVDLAYAESAHFVSWLAKTHGDAVIQALIRDVAAGRPFQDVFSEQFGRSPRSAFQVWRESVTREESVLASIFSRDGIFFMISIFGAFALVIALWRKSSVRKARLTAMSQDVSRSNLPPNLRNFGPFQKR